MGDEGYSREKESLIKRSKHDCSFRVIVNKDKNILSTVVLVAVLGAGISAKTITNVTVISDIEDRGIGLYTNGVTGFTWINETTISVGDWIAEVR